ncbi:MAG: 5-carboxymethyl-2-hydroxymuconate isomerase [Rhodospirillaceae bacterium]|nr:5-carboxymethyl-2-hydroxymuconate isomerase [Rhodospirillaceae bacterium]|tara:strand:- start:1044 stop:1913 length:870 start_codon:yes stop_codon:yes gene_type:complete
MKLCTFQINNKFKLGLVKDKSIVDLSLIDPKFNTDMRTLLDNWDSINIELNQILKKKINNYYLDEVNIKAPINNPQKFLAMGLNYQKHVEEVRERGVQVSDYQLWFNKQVSCINGPFDNIEIPIVSVQLDYEVELAMVVGKKCRHLNIQEAKKSIAGFMICNDVSVRDWQFRTQTLTLGKSFDTHGPIGPFIITPDEIGNPHNLKIECRVNNEVRQSANTNDLLFSCYDQLVYLSKVMTLMPGDIISTGTPSGVGVAMTPQNFLKVNDIVKCNIENIGHIENKVVKEKF